METLSVAEAKRKFSELADQVAGQGRRFAVTRRGRAVLALVPIEEAQATEERGVPSGLAAAAGLLGDCPRVLDGAEDAWRSRRKAKDRPAPRL